MSAVLALPALPADVAISPVSGFDSLGLHAHVMAGVSQAGYTEPTAVQAAAIPVLLDGLDAIVSSQTGSGKTAMPAIRKTPKRKPKAPRLASTTKSSRNEKEYLDFIKDQQSLVFVT